MKGKTIMENMLKRLVEVTKNCREDMHEPDEQGLSAVTSGFNFDNAFGDSPFTNAGELTVGIRDDKSGHIEWFNLATLIALARKADI
jgi:PP-loop superfamily ATP-utilizing enzyme